MTQLDAKKLSTPHAALHTASSGSAGSAKRQLFALLLLAALVRGLRLSFLAPLVEIEGSEYGRIATNLLAGEGYVGLIAGPELMLPPLFPLCMAGVSWLFGCDVVMAGRIISLVAGLVAVASVWQIVRMQASLKAAMVAGVLTTLLPVNILIGSSVFSEGLLLGLLGATLLCFYRTLQKPCIPRAALTGVCFGLLYLTRIETIALAPGAAAILAFGGSALAPRKRRWASAAALIVLTVATGIAYPIWLQGATGQADFAGKSRRVFATIERFSGGMDLQEANFALNERGEEAGPWLQPNAPYDGPSLTEIVGRSGTHIASNVGKNLTHCGWLLATGKGVPSILFFALGLCALLARRCPSISRFDLFLLWLCLSTWGMASIYKVLLRYLVPFSLPLIILAARGLEGLVSKRSEEHRSLLRMAAAFILLLSSSRGIRDGHMELHESLPGPAVEMKALATAQDLPQEALMLADDSRVPFYAGTWWLPLPISKTPEHLLAYALRRGATHIAIRTPDGKAGAYPGKWFAPQSPPSWMVPLGATPNREFTIWRIDR